MYSLLGKKVMYAMLTQAQRGVRRKVGKSKKLIYLSKLYLGVSILMEFLFRIISEVKA